MNKRVKKWIKRVLLWAVGLPVVLVIALYVTLECLPQEYSNRVFEWGLSFFVPFHDYEEANKDSDLIFDYGDIPAACGGIAFAVIVVGSLKDSLAHEAGT